MPRVSRKAAVTSKSEEPKKPRTRKPLMGVGTVETIEIQIDGEMTPVDLSKAEKAVSPTYDETILKVKVKGSPKSFEEIDILYAKLINDTLTECHPTPSSQLPHPDLFTAMNRLMPLVISTTRLGDEWENGWVSGISFKANDEGIGCVITAQADFGEGRAIVNTRYLKPDELNPLEIQSVITQVRNYLHGKRAQASLFDGGDAA